VVFPANLAFGKSFCSDYDALRALDADNSPHAPSMSEEEINALPVFKYKVQAQKGNASARKR
jgi:E3 ubiquitin-protein ligase SDIR1